LLDGTKIPKATSLPDDIKSLALRSALDLGHGSFQIDLDRLVQQLKVRAREVSSPFESMFGKVTGTKLALILLLALFLGALPVVLSRQSTKHDPAPLLSGRTVTTGRIPVPVTSPLPQDWSTLAPVSCDEEKNLRASATRSPTKIGFLNSRSTPVRTYWLNDMGVRVRYSELAPGQSVEQSTFVTHPWLVADEQDHCIAIYLPGPSPAVALLK
jgi:VHL beta domain